jgi:hypothetical protein
VTPEQTIQTLAGAPTPDDLDALITRVWKTPSFFLTHPQGIAAFGREATDRADRGRSAPGRADRGGVRAGGAAGGGGQPATDHGVSVLACERTLAGLDGRPADSLEEESRIALAQVPDAAQWARSFTARGFARAIPASPQAFCQRSAPFIVHAAVEGIAQAYIPQPDEMLRELLIGAIGLCARQAGRGTPA